MNSAAKGNSAELKTTKLLEAEGWVVGSRRHLAGPGDLLAVRATTWTGAPLEKPRLIEVKARVHLWQGFRREDRKALAEYCEEHGLVAQVAWWKPRARAPVYLGVAEWPTS